MVARRIAVVLLALTLSGCLEPPVSESLELRLLPGGASIVTVGVALRDPSDYDQAPRVKQRLESEARELAAETDPWSARLRRAEPERELSSVERDRGRLSRVRRRVLLKDPADLDEFFRDTGVDVVYAEGDGWAELTLTPGRPGRATAAQRQRLEREVSSFGDRFAEYAAAMRALYAYLEANPDRARICLGEILSVKEEGGTLTAEEEPLAGRVNDAIGALGAILDPASGEGFTLDELSRLVYDPFPAPMRVTVPGTIVEREGFPGELASELKIPVYSMWSAFTRLEGRWFFPDPALALWRDDAAKTGKPFDLDAFLAIPRRAAIAPTAGEARGALANQLRPEPVYRVRYQPAAADEAEALRLMAPPEP